MEAPAALAEAREVTTGGGPAEPRVSAGLSSPLILAESAQPGRLHFTQ